MVSIKRIVFLLSLLIGLSASAQQPEQGIPYYETISPFFIGYEGPWNSVVQDAENVLYFENRYGVVFFDGASWKMLKTHGTPTLCQDKNGIIYVGAVDFLGRIETDDCNRKFLKTVLDSAQSFGKITDVVAFNNSLFFIARGKLFTVKDFSPLELDIDVQVKKLFSIRGKLYVASEKNLYELSGNNHLVYVASISVEGALLTDDSFVFVTNNGFVKIAPDNQVVPFPTEIDTYIKKGEFQCISRTINNRICVGTKSHGIICLSEKGKILFSLDVSNGFPDNKISDLFVDRDNNIWATTNSDIVRIEINSAITYYNKYNGLFGGVYGVARCNGILYVGTDRGIFKLLGDHFDLIKGVSCNVLQKYKETVVAGTDEGLFIGDLNSPLVEGEIKNIHICEGKLIVVTPEKLEIYYDLSKDDNTVKFSKKYSTDIPAVEITSMACDQANVNLAMLGTKCDGIWMLAIDSVNQLRMSKCEWQGLPKDNDRMDVFETSQGCVYSTSHGLYRCELKNKFFYKDGKIMVPATDYRMWISPVKEDKDKNLWMAFRTDGSYESQIGVAWNTNNSELYTLITAPFVKIRKNHTTTILPEDNSIVWFGGNTGLIRMDFNKISVKKNIGNVRLSKVAINGDSVLTQKEKSVKLPYDTKSISFEFASVEFENHDDIYYSYYLEGQEKIWSEPSQVTTKEYTNLPAGKYVFHVRAKRAGSVTSKETVFEFEVKRNPLLSPWAFSFYLLLIAFVVLWHYRAGRKIMAKKMEQRRLEENKVTQKKQEEHKKEDFKLNNGLSDDSIRELQSTGHVRSMNFDLATVLFSDFKGFTEIAQRVSADSLIRELDMYFSEFDKIVEKYNVEKIKTVGDTYMCAGGIPKKNTTNPIEVVAAALEIQYRIAELQKENAEGAEKWGVRIGIHTGPLIAGVVGSKKSSYDIWGDSVNIASSMEVAGEVGRVNVSESTFLMVREFFNCEYRGKVSLKGKETKMDTYFVNGFKTMFTENPLKALPNKEFTYKLALLRFEGLQEQMYTIFEENIPKKYYYHSLKHTIDVVVQVEAIGQAEGINDDDMYILKTAALFHDSGFMQTYAKHEHASIEIARNYLSKENYTPEQINRVCRLIECTMITEEPTNLLEKIIRDADLDYLGRSDYMCVANELYKELLEQKLVKKNEYEWYVGQVKFLQEHKYYTDYSRSRRNPEKVKHIQWLQEQITKFNNIN
ncbi:MAG: HD domain-containing protein [Bacteroidales bacterium]|nr:HD domain-containing protein [Bacteroidales bacterium]